MKKFILDLQVAANTRLHSDYVLLRLSSSSALPPMMAGQFAQIRVDHTPSVFLRRPISIHYVDSERREVWFLIRIAAPGTLRLSELEVGETVNVILPLGHPFSMPACPGAKVLLVGGGVGCAPLLYLGQQLASAGTRPAFLIGARSRDDLLQTDLFAALGDLYLTTEDGSAGQKGFVTNHSVLDAIDWQMVYSCGPTPMMKAVARFARAKGIDCEVSLENRMACGIGACLCCVEDTVDGNLCVCREGPVFNIKRLKW